jgi:RimJ/RimL family protein N-acetyltransferase
LIRTERLVLRQWRDSDRDPFAALNGDPETMRFFPAPLTREDSDALVDRASAHIAEHGWGLWAVEVADGAPFIGFVGLSRPRFAPELVEVGWRLHRDHWGNGYATEAARECLRYGFEELGLGEIVSFTTVANTPSRRVMERIGMTHDPSRDFDHPNTPDWPLKRHVFYAIAKPYGAVTVHSPPT